MPAASKPLRAARAQPPLQRGQRSDTQPPPQPAPSPVPSLSGPQGRSRRPEGPSLTRVKHCLREQQPGSKPCRVVTVTGRRCAVTDAGEGRGQLGCCLPYLRFRKALHPVCSAPALGFQASWNPGHGRLLPETPRAARVAVTRRIRVPSSLASNGLYLLLACPMLGGGWGEGKRNPRFPGRAPAVGTA